MHGCGSFAIAALSVIRQRVESATLCTHVHRHAAQSPGNAITVPFTWAEVAHVVRIKILSCIYNSPHPVSDKEWGSQHISLCVYACVDHHWLHAQQFFFSREEIHVISVIKCSFTN